jgi:hypothetical protein
MNKTKQNKTKQNKPLKIVPGGIFPDREKNPDYDALPIWGKPD